ncbi:MAG: GGDEF/EAL domain-containing response regulator [Geminicoccaceae bacterium]
MTKVLLVDDVPEQLMAYRRLLRGHFDIVTADGAAAALDLLKQNADIQVIVSDMSMPHMNGIDFFVRAAKLAPKSTRIMLTGNTDMNATIEAINRGRVFRYLKKPCPREDLIEAIEAGLELPPPDLIHEPADQPARAVDAAPRRIPMVDRLQEALQSNMLQAFFQPIVDLKTGKMLGAEALARWRHPADGWIPPAVFIPIAEQYGLMPHLGRAMLMMACRDAQAWRRLGFDGWVSVNVSVTQFVEGRMVADVRSALEDSGLPSRNLTLELTEGVLVHDPESIIQTLEELRTLGVTLAIDDFGTGFSSLAYLKYLPVDRLKIDQCFVKEIDQDERDRAFVGTMLDLAKRLDLTVVAEGVERPAQRRALLNLGCGLGQGYLFEKALDIAAFSTLITGASIGKHQPANIEGF